MEPEEHAQRGSGRRYSPPEDVVGLIAEIVLQARRRDEADARYRSLLTLAVNERDVPVAYLAEQLGVERKTVYRHAGRSMT